jgi:hypothetical protein
MTYMNDTLTKGFQAQAKRLKKTGNDSTTPVAVEQAIGVVELPLSLIRTNGGTQSRAEINTAIVTEYAELMEDGTLFPSLTVFYDGEAYWLADGFHRYAAAKRLDYPRILCDVRQGTQRDAVLFSVGANAAHGLNRTNADKRRAVEKLLSDPEWSQWSDRKIAKACGVSHTLVSDMRPAICQNLPDTRKVERGGQTYTMNVARPAVTDCPFSVGDTVRIKGQSNVYTVIGINPGGTTVRLKGERATDVRPSVLVAYLEPAEVAPKVGEEAPIVVARTVGYETGFPVSPTARLPEVSARAEDSDDVIDVTIRSDVDPIIPPAIIPVYSVTPNAAPGDLMSVDQYLEAIRAALIANFTAGEIVYVEHIGASGTVRDALKARVVIHE